jgi:hypothetical protein
MATSKKHPEGDDDLKPEVSPGGSEILRHEPNLNESDDVTYLSEEDMEAIEDHLAEHVGPIAGVFHEIVSDTLHLDLVGIDPTPDRPHFTLSTMGMSALPMTMPDGMADEDAEGPGTSPYVELVFVLPPDWPRTKEEFEEQGEAAYWPFRWIKELARIPADYDTFLGFGHTIPNGDPPEPLCEGCDFVGFLIAPHMLNEEGETNIAQLADRRVEFLQVMPLFAEEMQLKLDKGVDALLDLLEEAVPLEEMANPRRVNVAK